MPQAKRSGKGKAEPNKGGRPSAYREEFAEQAFKLCLLGATDAEMADFFGVTETTINNWKRSHPKFLSSLKAGKEKADAEVSERLYQRAMGFEHPEVKVFLHEGKPVIVPITRVYAPDTTAAIFWLKNRRPQDWRDKQQHEHTGAGGGPIETRETVDPAVLSTSTLKLLLAEIKAREAGK